MAALAVLGSGSWGTALAVVLAARGHDVVLWGRDPEQIRALAATRCNRRYLPDIRLPDALVLTERLRTALAGRRDFLVSVPSHGFRSVLEEARPHLRSGARCGWATKGLDPGTGTLLHEVAAEVLPPGTPRAVLSGPTFAHEVAAGLPTAITVASDSPALAEEWSTMLTGDRLRVYTSDDLVGVGLGGAVKNVLAIAAGIADGLGFGSNARAALVARGLQEMMRLAVASGARRETLMGLAGLGDLVLTCTDDHSRNRRFGLALGRGEEQARALAAIGQVVEGIATAREVMRRARALAVEMPICEQVSAVIEGSQTPGEAVSDLFARKVGAEFRS